MNKVYYLKDITQNELNRLALERNMLQQENEELKNKIENITKINLSTYKYASDMEGKYIIEKYKNDKAIEYIKEELCCYDNESDEYRVAKVLLKILKGSDE
jgi:hypothetical protein